MATWFSTNPQMGWSVPGSVDTVASAPLGTVAEFRSDTLGNAQFVYLPGVASTVAGDVVSYQIVYGATGATAATVRWAGTANTGSPLAIATAANVASTYGWYQLTGAAIVNTSGTVAAGDAAFFSATATLKTAAVNGKQVLGCVAASANGVPATNQTIYTISWPHAQGQVT